MQRPKFIDPKAYLNSAASGLFDIGYNRKSKEMIPTGWTSITEDAEYPPILSRIPQRPSEVDANNDESDCETRDRDSSQSSDEDDVSLGGGASTRMAEESDASDDELPPPIVQRVCYFICFSTRHAHRYHLIFYNLVIEGQF